MQRLGLLWILIWGSYCIYLVLLASDLLSSGTLPGLFWLPSAITVAGLSTGILAIRGLPLWKWFGLGSSAAFLPFVYYLWSANPGTWQEIVHWLVQSDPRGLFDLVVMPLLA